jgi:HPt (histidine-containing phosphotransfer) domain-containing protein
LKAKLFALITGALAIVLLTFLWQKTRSVAPADNARIESSLRELRSLDRTINQDVLRARYQLIDGYEPVLVSYRNIEKHEAVIASPQRYLEKGVAAEFSRAVREYEQAVSAKQTLIEVFKYRAADLKDLLGYLPGAGTGIATAAAESGDEELAKQVNHVLEQTLLYNLTSDESYAPRIAADLSALTLADESLRSFTLKRRVRTLTLNVRRLLKVKPETDELLRQIFAAPVMEREEGVASIYYRGYADAERLANRYRSLLYGCCLLLLSGVVMGVLRLRHTAQALALANEQLEQRVAERTRELDARNANLRTVLDNVDQALFAVDLDGRLGRERSQALSRFLPEASAADRLWDVIAPLSESAARWLELNWAELKCGELPTVVVLDQMPKRLHRGGRHFELEYRAIGAIEPPERILVMLSDITDRVERAVKEVEQREQLNLFQHLLRDRRGLLEFATEAGSLVDSIVNAQATSERGGLLRALHTLKGNAALYGIGSVAQVCHELESKLQDGANGLEAADRKQVSDAWAIVTTTLAAFNRDARAEHLQLSGEELKALRRAIENGAPSLELLRQLNQMTHEPAALRLARVADQARSIALRLGKGAIEVSTNAADFRLDPERFAPFWSAFVHVLRNALDHGIESAPERRSVGKPSAGKLTLHAWEAAGDIVIELQDDGRGIDWDTVRGKARALGLTVDSDEDLSRALFHGGISTRSEVSEFSGRGAGVSACYNACLALGGRMSITTARGDGTTFRFSIPKLPQPVPLSSVA